MTREEASEIINSYFFYTVLPRCNGKVVNSRKLEEAIKMALEALNQPEPKKGKWIECERVDYTQFHPDYSSFYSTFRCTSCLKANYRKEKYCPNCGAKMEVEE